MKSIVCSRVGPGGASFFSGSAAKQGVVSATAASRPSNVPVRIVSLLSHVACQERRGVLRGETPLRWCYLPYLRLNPQARQNLCKPPSSLLPLLRQGQHRVDAVLAEAQVSTDR